MALKKINDKVIENVDKRQKELESVCNVLNNNINKLLGQTDTPMMLSLFGTLTTLIQVVKENFDFTRSGFDYFLEEIKNLNNELEKFHENSEKKS